MCGLKSLKVTGLLELRCQIWLHQIWLLVTGLLQNPDFFTVFMLTLHLSWTVTILLHNSQLFHLCHVIYFVHYKFCYFLKK